MKCPEGQLPNPSEKDSTPTASTSEVMSFHDPQSPVDLGADTAGDRGAETAGDQGSQTPADHGAQADAESGAQAAAGTPLENLLKGKEHASAVRKIVHSTSVAMKDKLKIDLSPDGHHAVVEVEDVSLTANLVDLPCVIGSLKTLDKKTFYKTADISQMLVCTADGDPHSSPEEPTTSTDLKVIAKNEREGKKKYVWKHGITPPLKNVRKKRFRKTIKSSLILKKSTVLSLVQYIESPEVEKEVKKLLCSDAEAVSTRWEVIAEDETKEIESQGFIPGFKISPGMSGYKQGHVSSECEMLREMFSDSSSNSDKDDDDDEEEEDDYDDDEDEEEEKDYYEEDVERKLQAKFIEPGQHEAKERASSIVMEIQKQIHHMEKKLLEIQCKAQRQKNLIMKLENLMLKNHLQSVLEQLKLEKKKK